jgi:hypothetical protein
MYSGKTTLARQLEQMHGYTLVDYTGHLKEMVARMLTAGGVPTTRAVIERDKAYYRPLLQMAGTYLGFDQGRPIEHLLAEACFDPIAMNCSLDANIVFDNVRTPEQWAILKALGFQLVRLHVTNGTQIDRAERAGVPYEELERVKAHRIETPLPVELGEISVWSWDVDQPSDLTNLVAALANEEASVA